MGASSADRVLVRSHLVLPYPAVSPCPRLFTSGLGRGDPTIGRFLPTTIAGIFPFPFLVRISSLSFPSFSLFSVPSFFFHVVAGSVDFRCHFVSSVCFPIGVAQSSSVVVGGGLFSLLGRRGRPVSSLSRRLKIISPGGRWRA